MESINYLITSIDENIAIGWNELLSTDIANWDVFEAYVAGSSFAIWIMMYRIMDQFKVLNKYRFEKDKNAPVVLFLPDPNNSWIPLISYILIIHLYHYIYPKPLCPMEAPPIVRLVIECIIGFVVYDFLFFWVHLLMHLTPKLAFIHQHNVHHHQKFLTASEVQHHSLLDSIFQVGINIAVQNISLPFYGRKHYASRLLHNVLITYMLTESHAGYDFPWSLHNLFPLVYGGAKRHEAHHKYNNIYYQQFLIYLDDIYNYVTNNVEKVKKQHNANGGKKE